MKEKKGLKVLVSSLFAASMLLPTFCVEGKLNAAANLVYTIAKWGGGIIAFAGLALIGKAFMDSTSGQSQPGQLIFYTTTVSFSVISADSAFYITPESLRT